MIRQSEAPSSSTHVYDQSVSSLQTLPESISSSATWGGVNVNLRTAEMRDGVECRAGLKEHVLQLNLIGSEYSDQRRNGRRVTGPMSTDAFNLLPAGEPFTWVWDNSFVHRTLHVSLDPIFLSGVAEHAAGLDPSRVHLHHDFAFLDGGLRCYVELLRREVAGEGYGSRLYIDAVAQSLAVHLLRRFGTHGHERLGGLSGLRGRLDAHRLDTALDCLHSHIDANLCLDELARSACMSPYHFARLFKKITGLAPHQYQVRLRVEKAQGLIRRGGRALADIALACGFTDQAHFTRHFKRVTGTTPGRFARDR